MVVRWYQRQEAICVNIFKNEQNKLILKGLLSAVIFNKDCKIYFGKLFFKYDKFCSFSFLRKFCVKTGFTRSVSRRFKLVRHQCKFYAANGYLVGLRKHHFKWLIII